MSPDDPWIGWVDNGDDSPHTVTYLHHLAQYRRHPGAAAGDFAPIVVRPTPGGEDRMALGFDLLTALGKSPEIMHGERTRLRGGGVWGNARAWLIGSQVTDVFLDRAHQLSTKLLLDLADAARPRPRHGVADLEQPRRRPRRGHGRHHHRGRLPGRPDTGADAAHHAARPARRR